MPSTESPRPPPPPWLFGITNLSFGISGGYTSVAMPFILRQAGVPVGTIAAASAAVLIPMSYQFLWAPVLDVGLRRRAWLVLFAALSALLLGLSLFLDLPSQLLPFEICCVLGQGCAGLVSSCNGALVATTVPGAWHGRASGWLNAANLGGNAIGGGLVLGVTRYFGAHAAGLMLAILCLLPTLAVVSVRERPRLRRRPAEVFGGMLRDVWHTASSRRGWTGILFCLAPVSTPALLDLFSAIGEDFHAPAHTVELSMGYGSGLVTAFGALLGGRLLDRAHRRTAYLLSGLLVAVVDLAMAYAPLTPQAYVAGTLCYSLVAGLCYAAFTAVVFEIIDGADRSAAVQYTLFDAAGNLATSYLAWLDGLGYDYYKSRHLSGPAGMLLTDAGMNVAGACALGLLMLALFSRGHRQRQAA
ncbi:MAG: MFS transporter [Nevskia sp.]|nr:MFS transporter [Nevskia sp.]